MPENKIQERMLEYNRVLDIESAYISLNLGIRLFVVRLDQLNRKSITLDNLWFWTSYKQSQV